MKNLPRREVNDYWALMTSLEMMEARESGTPQQSDSLTSRLAAADMLRVIRSHTHTATTWQHCWPVPLDGLHMEHPLLHPIRHTLSFTQSPMSKNKHLKAALKVIVSKKVQSIDAEQVLATQTALLLEQVVERVVEVRQALNISTVRPSSWETVLDIVPLVCRDSRVVDRVHKRLFSLFNVDKNVQD